MAIHRGIQSAIFYYLSCAPCAEARVRRQRKEEAKRDRLDRMALEAEMPDLYRHPSPSSTNPYWQTEIQLGPTPVARGKKRTTTAGGAGRASSNASRNPSSVDLPPGSSASTRNDSKINLRLTQRQDEELWGSSTNLDGSHSRETLPRRPPRALTKEEAAEKGFRNPAINDLHPATVTRVTSRDDVMWMMQPVPVAEVMNGKEQPTRTGFTPTASPRFAAISDRAADLSLRLGSPSKSSLGAVSRESSSRASNRPPNFASGSNTLSPGQRHDRSNSTVERDFALVAPPRSVAGGSLRGRSPQLSPVADTVMSLDATSPSAVRRLSSQNTPRLSPLVRPLSTVVSSESLSPSNEHFLAESQPLTPARTLSVRNDLLSPMSYDAQNQPSRRGGVPDNQPKALLPSAVLVHDSSLKLAQDLNPGAALIKAQIVMAPTRGALQEARVSRNSNDRPSIAELTADRKADANNSKRDSGAAQPEDTAQPESFEDWQSPEFELPKWILEHTKREGVSERWSMDL